MFCMKPFRDACPVALSQFRTASDDELLDKFDKHCVNSIPHLLQAGHPLPVDKHLHKLPAGAVRCEKMRPRNPTCSCHIPPPDQ